MASNTRFTLFSRRLLQFSLRSFLVVTVLVSLALTWGYRAFVEPLPAPQDDAQAQIVPVDWDIGGFDRKKGTWDKAASRNVRWVAPLGSQTYGPPAVSGGKVFIGTNNGAAYLKRYPSDVDVSVLLCFSIDDGRFLWQHSNEKLPTGRVHDWPLQGVCSKPWVEGDRLWYVTNRCEVVCLDVEGFLDGVDDGDAATWGRLFEEEQANDPAADNVAPTVAGLKQGHLNDWLRTTLAERGMPLPDAPFSVDADNSGAGWETSARIGGVLRRLRFKLVGPQLSGPWQRGPRLSGFVRLSVHDKDEADVVWKLDMMQQLGVSPHNMSTCNVIAVGRRLFVCTSNGVDESHVNLPKPDAPSFICLDKHTGKLLWSDKSPGRNILHGQWGSPAYGVLGGVAQIIFPGGDGWLYSFDPAGTSDGKGKLLWKFDTNPKTSQYILGGRGTRNELVSTPVVHEGLVYIGTGQDPEHGEGDAVLWCIDPTRRGDVSPELVFNRADPTTPIPHKRRQACVAADGDFTRANPNSAEVWRYTEHDRNGDGKFDYDERFHRNIGRVAIKGDLLFAADFSGILHCIDLTTGKPHWAYDMLAASWGPPSIFGDHLYAIDEDGDVVIFRLSSDPAIAGPMREISMDNTLYTAPTAADNVLYLPNKTHLFAIEEAKTQPVPAARP